jgi:hypothetical protein
MLRVLPLIGALCIAACGQTAAPVEETAPPVAAPEVAAPAAPTRESWTCSYMDYAIREGEAPRTVIVRFSVDGDELIDGSFGQRYRILQNNQHALIAVWSIAEVEPNRVEPSIAAWAIAIDKSNGFFSRVNLIGRPGESGFPRDGSCIRDGR